MNREQRRAHFKQNKNNPNAIFCPRCDHKTRHVALPGTVKEACNIVCVICGNKLRRNVKGYIPYTYVEGLPE